MIDASPTIEVAIECPAWFDGLAEPEAVVRRAAIAALHASGFAVDGETELGVLLADDDTVRALNRRYLGRDRPTNVLAFPSAADPETPTVRLPGLPVMVGDVVLAYQTVVAEAAAQGKALADHVSHLVVHGVLHCTGRDHDVESRALEMERLEISILAGLGIGDPYRTGTEASIGGSEINPE